MNKSDRVREYLKTNPWSTNNQIAAALGLRTNDVAAITTYGFTRLKNEDRLIRKDAYPTAGRPCFAYALAAANVLAAAGGVPGGVPMAASTPAVAPTPTGAPAAASTPTGAPPPAASLEAVLTNLAEQLAEDIYKKVCEKLNEKLMSLVQTRKSTTPEEFVESLLNNIKTPKTSLLIVGLLPQQSEMINNEFKEHFNLRFHKEGSLAQLRNTAKNADFVITFTSKISHDMENTIKSVNSNIIRVTGGMTSLREKLTEIYCEN